MPVNSELSELIADVKEQILYLQELGVASLDVELPMTVSIRPKDRGSAEGGSNADIAGVPAPARAATVRKAERPSGGLRIASLPSLANRTVSGAFDIPPIDDAEDNAGREADASANTTSNVEEPFTEIKSTLPETSETIEMIRADIGNCTRCTLCEGRKQIVHSAGNLNADLMFVGEAPGADEDEQGRPFVGRAGQLLTKIIESIGMTRDEVFIGNINRCRPPGNRQPTLAEAETCRPFLHREIAVVRPKVIVVMGNTATQNLLNTKIGITRLRGEFQEYLGVKLMPTFHPAYLLRDPNKKREVWEDMKKVRDFLQK